MFLKMDKDGNPENPDAKKWVTNYYTAHMEKQHKSGQSNIYHNVNAVKAQLKRSIDKGATEMMDPNSGRYNTIEEVEDMMSYLTSTYGQLDPKEQKQLDQILVEFEKKENELRNQNKYNTNAQ